MVKKSLTWSSSKNLHPGSAGQELIAGKFFAPLKGGSESVRYVGHHVVLPRRQRRQAAVEQFKAWLFKDLQS